jgi:hypothetical protein
MISWRVTGSPAFKELPQTCGIDVLAQIARFEAVVGGVVQTSVAERGAEGTCLGRVVEDYVEQDLEPGAVQGVDHCFELTDLAPGPAGPHGS